MVAKFLDLNTTVFLQIRYETTKKIDLYDFPPYDCTQEQHSNKMTKQAIVGHMCLQRAPENMGYFNSVLTLTSQGAPKPIVQDR